MRKTKGRIAENIKGIYVYFLEPENEDYFMPVNVGSAIRFAIGYVNPKVEFVEEGSIE